MLNMEALDKIIAVVTVILVLSLFVQSLQALLKKLFKIKSLQIETSLVHLFHYVVNGNTLELIKSRLNNSPFLRLLMRGQHPSEANADVKALYCGIEREFRKVGRVTATGKMMLDSISKEDVLKFIGKIQDSEMVKRFAPELATEVTTLKAKAEAVETSLQTIKTENAAVLSTAGVQFDKIEQAVAPLVGDIRKILSGQTVAADMALADIGKLGGLGPEQVSAVQSRINEAITRLSKLEGGNAATTQAAVTALRGLNDALNGLATVAPGIASIKSLLGKVETWYDTVMQSFEERYTRGMRTWAWVISALVVILLNADLLNIYHSVATSDVQRAAILKAAENLRSQEAQSFPDPQKAEEWLNQARSVINEGAKSYTSMGFEGPAWINQSWQWLRHDDSPDKWRNGIVKAIKTLFGWFVMTLLLSAGAPFWEDVLESLFGVKNLVRGKSGTRNVEERSGEGQPKP
ncbi:MAG: hypothetical protein ACJ74J_13100 [Blastocatellia bacterium]